MVGYPLGWGGPTSFLKGLIPSIWKAGLGSPGIMAATSIPS